MKHCKDCEPAQQLHFVAYTSVVLGIISKPFFGTLEFFFKNTTEAISKRISLPFFRSMIFLKLGHYSYEPDEKDSWRTKCFWEEAKKRKIKMREFHLGPIREIFVAEYNGKEITFDGLPRPGAKESESLTWMDNKGIMKKRFKKEGIPVARGAAAWRIGQALKIFRNINKPVIVKPNLGSRSRHTTIHINSEKELVTAFRKARKLSPIAIVEEELKGPLFRGTLIGGKLAGVMRRDPPRVIGDGKNDLKTLFETENSKKERSGPLFHKIAFDQSAEEELERQKIGLGDIPEEGRIVTFSQKTSRGIGGTTEEINDPIHPDNVEMLEKIGKYLDDPLIGVDFIIEDVFRSWKDQPLSGVIECNSLPFIDLHHYPFSGKPTNVAGKLWDLVFPESGKHL